MNHHRVTGTLAVPLPPEEAFGLFTARGEERWAAGWVPRFPRDTPDDTVPGTVFETTAHDATTTWLVVDSAPGRHIRYARVTPGTSAGTVEVTLAPDAGGSEVTVTYELTALSPAEAGHLDAFAAGYPGFLASWHESITAALGVPGIRNAAPDVPRQ